MALTSQRPEAGFPLSLEFESRKLPKKSWLKISQIRTLAIERIGKKIAKASPEEIEHAVAGFNEVIGA